MVACTVRDEDGSKVFNGQRDVRLTAAAAMNTTFAIGEVITAFKALHNNISGGLDGVPAEAFKYARHEVDNKTEFVMEPHLLKPIEHIRVTGDYPRQFEISQLAPIHKKGDVITTAGQLLAIWAERHTGDNVGVAQ